MSEGEIYKKIIEWVRFDSEGGIHLKAIFDEAKKKFPDIRNYEIEGFYPKIYSYPKYQNDVKDWILKNFGE